MVKWSSHIFLILSIIFISNCKTITIDDDSIKIDIPDEIELIKIPSGVFYSGENSTKDVINYDYLIMKYPVTNLQYINYLIIADSLGIISIDTSGVYGFYRGDKYWPPGNYKYADFTNERSRIGFYPPDNYFVRWRYVENRKEFYYDHPVTNVTWFGADAFARLYGMGLPTNSEWEKAARANSNNDYPWGNKLYTNISNFRDSGDSYDNDTTPVWHYSGKNNTKGNYSPYGVMDMAGNTWDWTNSWWRDSSGKVIKGGSFNSLSHSVRADSIYCYEIMTWFEPAIGFTPNNATMDIGFRCVKDIED